MRKQLVESDRIPLYGAFEDEYTLFSRENVIGKRWYVSSFIYKNRVKIFQNEFERIWF